MRKNCDRRSLLHLHMGPGGTITFFSIEGHQLLRQWAFAFVLISVLPLILPVTGNSRIVSAADDEDDDNPASKKPGKPKTAAEKKAAAKADADDDDPLGESEADVGFNFEEILNEASVPAERMVDKDSTSEGRQQLAVVAERAREVDRQRAEEVRLRRPLVLRRADYIGQIQEANVVAKQAIAARNNANGRLVRLRRARDGAANGDLPDYDRQIFAWQQEFDAAAATARNAEAIMARLGPLILQLNQEIRPHDLALRKLWNEMMACRKQWVDLREPALKYARGDFEKLKVVIDDWQRVDGLWPHAYCWAGLCAYELGEYDAAERYADEVDNLRREVFETRRPWPHVEALHGLIWQKYPARKPKAMRECHDAIVHANKNNKKVNDDWETFFLVGRAYMETPSMALRAKAQFDKALAIKPNNRCVEMWVAQLQLTSGDPKVKDVKLALKTFDRLFARTGAQSWRLHMLQAICHETLGDRTKAEEVWRETLVLAPTAQHYDVAEQRKALLAKIEKGNAKAAEQNKPAGSKKVAKSEDLDDGP